MGFSSTSALWTSNFSDAETWLPRPHQAARHWSYPEFKVNIGEHGWTSMITSWLWQIWVATCSSSWKESPDCRFKKFGPIFRCVAFLVQVPSWRNFHCRRNTFHFHFHVLRPEGQLGASLSILYRDLNEQWIWWYKTAQKVTGTEWQTSTLKYYFVRIIRNLNGSCSSWHVSLVFSFACGNTSQLPGKAIL